MAGNGRPFVLKGGNVFDSEQRTFVAGVDVVCTDGRITGVVASATVPERAEVLDCTGHFVLPGFIDCHVHLTSSGAANERSAVQGMSAPLRLARAAKHAEATLRAGFTLVRDLGAADHLNIELRKAIDRGYVTGPTILAAGRGVTMTGGHGHTGIAREADGPDEVRKAVREQLRAGADAIKMFASGGVMTEGVDPRSPSFTEEELRAGVEEAHKAFRVVGAHAQSTEGIKNAVRAGVDSVEHGIWLDEEAIGLMLERGTWLVPTLTAPALIGSGGEEAGIPAYAVEKSRSVEEDHIASFKAAIKAGVRVAAGTDQGTPLNKPGDNAQEMVHLVEHGLSPAAAILAATRWAAELLQLGDQRGRLAAGLVADAVILRADPLADIAVTRDKEQIAAVVKDGAVVHRNRMGASE